MYLLNPAVDFQTIQITMRGYMNPQNCDYLVSKLL